MPYGFLADVVVAAHFAYIGFVLFGQVAILVGAACRWKWVRNPWFRWLHLTMIVIVAGEAMLGITCPLTTWERQLRILDGQQPGEGSFIGRLLHDIIFYQGPEWVFSTAYISFALLVLVTAWFLPPRPIRNRPADA